MKSDVKGAVEAALFSSAEGLRINVLLSEVFEGQSCGEFEERRVQRLKESALFFDEIDDILLGHHLSIDAYAINPSKIIAHIGKFLSPLLLICLAVLVICVIKNPLGPLPAPNSTFVVSPFFRGFQEGYNMEVFESRDKRVTVIVDYAHNRMSFDALFRSAEVEYPGKRKIVVFGCPGKKAQLRRRDLGEMAGRHCDLAILTEEDPGEEPVHAISEEIGSYVASAGGAFVIADDRGEAIREAILEHGTDKVIFLTGKGRETRQKRGTLYIDTPSDVDFTEKYLAAYDAAVSPAVR